MKNTRCQKMGRRQLFSFSGSFTLTEDKIEFNEKTQIFPISQGVDFLGWHLYLTDTGKVIRRLRTSNKKRFKKRMKNFQNRYAKNQVSFEEITRSVRSYNGHLKHGDTWHLRKHIYNNLVFARVAKSEEILAFPCEEHRDNR